MDYFIRSCQKCNIKIGENETVPLYLNGKQLFCCYNCLMNVYGITVNNKKDLIYSITEEIKNRKNLAYNNYFRSTNKDGQKIANSKNQLISKQVDNYSKISGEAIQSQGLPKEELSKEMMLPDSIKMNPALKVQSTELRAQQQPNNKALHDSGQQQNYNAPRDSGQQQKYNAPRNFGQQQNYNAPHNFSQQQNYNALRDSGQQQNYNAPRNFGQQQNYNAPHNFSQQQNYNAPHDSGQQHFSASYDSPQQTNLKNRIGQSQEDKNSLSYQQYQGQNQVDQMIQSNDQLQKYTKWSDPSQPQSNWSEDQFSGGEPVHDEHLLDQEVQGIMNNYDGPENHEYEEEQIWQTQQNYGYQQMNQPVNYNNMFYYPLPAQQDPNQPHQYPQALSPYMVPTNQQVHLQPNVPHFAPRAPNPPNVPQPYGSPSVQNLNEQPLESNRVAYEIPPHLMQQNQQPCPPPYYVQTPHGYLLVQNIVHPYPVHIMPSNLQQQQPRQYLSPQPMPVAWPHLQQQQMQQHQAMYQNRQQHVPHQGARDATFAQSNSQPFQRDSRNSGQRWPDNRQRGGQQHAKTMSNNNNNKAPGSRRKPLLPLPNGREQQVIQQNNNLPPHQKPQSLDKSQPPQEATKSDLKQEPRCPDNLHPFPRQSKSDFPQKSQPPGNLKAPQQESRLDLQQEPKYPVIMRDRKAGCTVTALDGQAIEEQKKEPQQPEKRDQPDIVPKPRKAEVQTTSENRPRAQLCEKCVCLKNQGTSRESDSCKRMHGLNRKRFLDEPLQTENKTHPNCQAEDKIQSDSAAVNKRDDLLPDDEKYHDLEWLNKEIENLDLKDLQFPESESKEGKDELVQIEKHLSELRDRSPPAGTSPKPDEPIPQLQEAAQVQPIDEQLQPSSSPQESTTGKKSKRKKRKSQSSQHSEDSRSSSGRRRRSQGSRRSSYSSCSSSRRSSVSFPSRPERVNVNGEQQRRASQNNRQDQREPENNQAEEIPRAENNHPEGPGRDEPENQQPQIVNLLNDRRRSTPENDAQAPNDEPNNREAPRDQQNGNAAANGHQNGDGLHLGPNARRDMLAPIRQIRRARRRLPGILNRNRRLLGVPNRDYINGAANGNGYALDVPPLPVNPRRANRGNNGVPNERGNRDASPARQNQVVAQIPNRRIVIDETEENSPPLAAVRRVVEQVNLGYALVLSLNLRDNRQPPVLAPQPDDDNVPRAPQLPVDDNVPRAPQLPVDDNVPEPVQQPVNDQPANQRNREIADVHRNREASPVIIDRANENGHAPEWAQEPVNPQPNEEAPQRPNSPLGAAAPVEEPAPAPVRVPVVVPLRNIPWNELFRQPPYAPPLANGQNAIRPRLIDNGNNAPRRPRIHGQIPDDFLNGQRELPRNGEQLRRPDDERRREQDEEREEGGWQRQFHRHHRRGGGNGRSRPHPRV